MNVQDRRPALRSSINWMLGGAVCRRTGRFSGGFCTAVGFEVTLLVTSLPIYTWWLGLSILEALATDLVVTSFVVIYTYFFTLGYDRVFPVLATAKASLR